MYFFMCLSYSITTIKEGKNMNKWDVATKAIRVVYSCETVEQLTVAIEYCKRVGILFFFPSHRKEVNYNFNRVIKAKQQLLILKGGNKWNDIGHLHVVNMKEELG